MANEDAIKKELVEKFDFLAEKIIVKRERRIFTEPLDQKYFYQVFDYATNEMGFSILSTITGVDEGEVFHIIYHLGRMDGTMLNLKTKTPRANPVIKTVIYRFPNAENYEREMVDLLGIQVEGHPPGKRYPLPDDWPEGQYPLRKDWTPDMLKQKDLQTEKSSGGAKEEAKVNG
jgi:membrane-bound hydrogenase subunit beta